VATDLNGRVVAQRNVTGKTMTWNTADWAAGMYVVSGYKQAKRVFGKQLVVE
jgi:hypothetical protein